MSIILNGVSYAHPNQENLFSGISLSINTGQKVSLIGKNGSGKTTLLKIIAGELKPLSGEISIAGPPPYIVPQHSGNTGPTTVGSAIGIEQKLSALNHILNGSTDMIHFEVLDDQWDLEQIVEKEFRYWGIGHINPQTHFSTLSGGEKTKVYLAGIGINSPSVILMDEPTNHLDRQGREKLYDLLVKSPATILVVSHDRELLNLVENTLNLTSTGIEKYGGNYDFFQTVHNQNLQALHQQIENREKTVKAVTSTAKKAIARKDKSDARGPRKQKNAGVPRIMMNTLRDGAEKSRSNLKKVMEEKVDMVRDELKSLKDKLPDDKDLRLNFKDSDLHNGKILFEAKGLNFAYGDSRNLWNHDLDLNVLSGDRIHVSGRNGSGKSTLIKIITGELKPTRGQYYGSGHSYIYLDQEYTFVDDSLTVLGQVEKNNVRNLPDHEIKTELHRFLFPADSWDQPCKGLSGGEKMRLSLCSLAISNDTPDVFILDEPTNNLDINSMKFLTNALKNYKGALLVISHDSTFTDDIGADIVFDLDKYVQE